MERVRLFFLAVALVLSSAASAQRFDNKSVVALHHAGLGDNTIIAKVNGLPCSYDVSTDGLIALKQAGVSDDVIAAMVARCSASPHAQGVGAGSTDPAVAHPPGIYVMQDWLGTPKMQLMRPSKASGIKVTGNGSILLPYVGKLVLPDEHSRVEVKTHRPVFYFYFLAGGRKVSDFCTPDSVAAQSPDEFTLVRFKVRKDEREVGTGKVSAYSSRRGIDTKDVIRFETSEVGESAFKVSESRDLEPGEYAFVLTGANGTARVYDFTIA
ncbi:hypothetical protein [uncultured Sphingomonas sp.]|uniref:hypothetical protein n=1 Tax=uncultured Sphingomonas sp. TaxID=158754 RepID=UPI0035C9DF14